MTKWEYKSIATDRLDHPDINKSGAEGWEIIGFTINKINPPGSLVPREVAILLFKRPLPEVNLA